MMIAKLNHVRKSGINTNLDLEKNIAKIIVCLSHLYLEECSKLHFVTFKHKYNLGGLFSQPH